MTVPLDPSGGHHIVGEEGQNKVHQGADHRRPKPPGHRQAQHGVVREQTGQTDIAVLCSRKRVSSILVFRGGSAVEVDELASEPDAGYLQSVGNDRIGFSRLLSVATPEYIRSCFEALEEHETLEPPPLDHEGIEDYFVEKASTIWYWYGGKWLSLAGAD